MVLLYYAFATTHYDHRELCSAYHNYGNFENYERKNEGNHHWRNDGMATYIRVPLTDSRSRVLKRGARLLAATALVSVMTTAQAASASVIGGREGEWTLSRPHTCFPTSSLWRTDPESITALVGEEARLGFVVERRGGRPDLPLTVMLAPGGLAVRGPSAQGFPYVGDGRRGEFRVVGTAPGRYLAQIGANRYNEPSAVVTVTVTTAAVSAGGMRLVLAGSSLVALGSGLVLLRRRFS